VQCQCESPLTGADMLCCNQGAEVLQDCPSIAACTTQLYKMQLSATSSCLAAEASRMSADQGLKQSQVHWALALGEVTSLQALLSVACCLPLLAPPLTPVWWLILERVHPASTGFSPLQPLAPASHLLSCRPTAHTSSSLCSSSCSPHRILASHA